VTCWPCDGGNGIRAINGNTTIAISVGGRTDENSGKVFPRGCFERFQSVTYRDDQVNTTPRSLIFVNRYGLSLVDGAPAPCRWAAIM